MKEDGGIWIAVYMTAVGVLAMILGSVQYKTVQLLATPPFPVDVPMVIWGGIIAICVIGCVVTVFGLLGLCIELHSLYVKRCG